MSETPPGGRVEFDLLPPAAPIPPDDTGLPPGFSHERVRRLFASRVRLTEPPQTEGSMPPPSRPLGADDTPTRPASPLPEAPG